MNNQPPDDPQMPPDESLKELIAKMTEIKNTLAVYETNMPHHELKHIKNEKDMLEKMPFMKKALDLAFEHQELVTPEFLERFWENHVQFLNMKDLYDKIIELQKRLEEICPEAAKLPHKTTGTTTNG
jgi:hypothetical protein